MRILGLCGGVGGARFALALYEHFDRENLSFLVNSGDDFEHLGLEIWPDWDTVVYHLSQRQDEARGWGRRDEGTRFMEEIKVLGGPDWFHLGDRDLALHVYRSDALRSKPESRVAQDIVRAFGLECDVLHFPHMDRATRLLLRSGEVLNFQDWFVGRQCQDEVQEVLHSPTSDDLDPEIQAKLTEADLILLAPSNPYLSLDPMFCHNKFRQAFLEAKGTKYAVSPLVGGRAIKGPLDALIESLSPHSGQAAIAHHYSGLVDALILPDDETQDLCMPILACPTMLKTPEERSGFAQGLRRLLP